MTTTTEERKNAPIDPVVQSVLDRAWSFKENKVKGDFTEDPTGGETGGDIMPFVSFSNEDGSEVRLEFMCQRINKMDAIAVSKLVAPMLRSDWLVAILDTHISHQEINPTTGEKWKPGEMQKACDEDGACTTGVITDAITAMLVRRDGSTQMISRTYHVDKAKGEIHWVDIDSMDSRGTEAQVTGFVADALSEAVTSDVGAGLEKALNSDVPDEVRPLLNFLTACQLALAVVGGAAFPVFTKEEMDQHEDHIRKALTQEEVMELREAMAPLVMLLRAKWGLMGE